MYVFMPAGVISKYIGGGVFDSRSITTFQITGVGLEQPRARPRPLHVVAWGELVKKANLQTGTASVARNLVVSLLMTIAVHPSQSLFVLFFSPWNQTRRCKLTRRGTLWSEAG